MCAELSSLKKHLRGTIFSEGNVRSTVLSSLKRNVRSTPSFEEKFAQSFAERNVEKLKTRSHAAALSHLTDGVTAV
jgi:hypothetical protein